MNKVVPFKKEILFNTGIHEIVSISLEHTYNIEDNNIINGTFFINGEYRLSETSQNTDKFNKEVPFTIDIGENYKIDNISIDIDDFYYEIINTNYLSINIDLLIKDLEEIEIVPDLIQEFTQEEPTTNVLDHVEEEVTNNIDPRCVEEEEPLPEKKDDTYVFPEEECEEAIATPNFNDRSYSTYKIYIIKEEESLESVMTKFSINKETLEKYNNLENIQVGDKLIIPTVDARD